MPATSSPTRVFDEVRQDEGLRNGRVLAAIRLGTSTCLAGVALVGSTATSGRWILFAHAAVSLALFGAARLTRWGPSASLLALALLDVPTMVLRRWDLPGPDASLPSLGDPRAGLLLITAGAVFSFRPVYVALVAASAAAAAVLLQLRHGLPVGPQLQTVLLFAFGGGMFCYLTHRLSALVTNAGARMEQARASEQKVLDAEQSFLSFLERLPDPVLLHREGAILATNGPFKALLGLGSNASLVGRPIQELIHPEDGRLIQERIAKTLAGEVLPLIELRLKVGDQAVPVESRPTRVQLSGGPAVLVMLRDMRQRRTLQAQQMTADRLASMGMLAAGVAHELNNPLAAVLANLEFLEQALGRAGVTDPHVSEAVRESSEAARQVREILKDLRNFAREPEAEAKEIRLPELLESTLRVARSEVRHKAELVLDFAPAPTVRANAAKLGQVFLNLLVNAAQAMPEGFGRRNEIRLRVLTGPDGWAVVEVQDNGVGIPKELQGRLFEPFFTTKPPDVGTGLGLAICRRLIEASGGRIEVESAPGLGTTFRVHLPPASPAAEAPATAGPSAPVPSRRVLLVDDEAPVRSALKRLLGRSHHLTAAASAEEALQLLEGGERFELILCDVMMPGMTGPELYAEVQRRFPGQAERMTFITGGATTSATAEFLQRMGQRVLPKPVDGERLDELLRKTPALPAPSAQPPREARALS